MIFHRDKKALDLVGQKASKLSSNYSSYDRISPSNYYWWAEALFYNFVNQIWFLFVKFKIFVLFQPINRINII